MASITIRGNSFCVRWQAGRAGRKQCCTFRGPSDAKAVAAQHFIQAREHRVTSIEVYAAIDPRPAESAGLPPTPLLREWIERWLRLKIDVAETTHAEYARILRSRVGPDLGDLRVAEINRHDHKPDTGNC